MVFTPESRIRALPGIRTQPDHLQNTQGPNVRVLVIYLKPEAAENTTNLTIKTT